MKKFLLSTVAILAFGSIAGAADLPAKGPASVGWPACAAAQFQGGYIGINAGAVKHIANRTDADAFLNTESTLVTDNWGGIVGGTLGYNFAKCSTLWGIELDGSWASVSKTLVLDPSAVVAAQESLRVRMDAFATARLRAGIALDNMLLYLTGGVAAARFRTTYEDLNGGATPNDTATISEWRLGWVAGFGTEWAWTHNWTVKSEVLYANFADRDHNVTFPAGGPRSFRHSDSVWVSRLGVNYRF